MMGNDKLSGLEKDYALLCMLQNEMIGTLDRIADFFNSVSAIKGVEETENIFAELADSSKETHKILLDHIPDAFGNPERVERFMAGNRLAFMWNPTHQGESDNGE